MTGNFTMTTLISMLKSELNWHAQYHTRMHSLAKNLVDKALTGKLTEIDYDQTINAFTMRRLYATGYHNPRSLRTMIIHRLNMARANPTDFIQELHQVNSGYRESYANSKIMFEDIYEELMRYSGLVFLNYFFRKYNYDTADIKNTAPWTARYSRIDLIDNMISKAREQYPYGLQILHEEPRTTDEYSTELYREADEIIGALEKLNADPKYKTDMSKHKVIVNSYDGFGDLTGEKFTNELSKLLDGKPLEQQHDADDFDEEINFSSHYHGFDPEKSITKLISNDTNHQAVLKALISAIITKDDHLREVAGYRHQLAIVVPGYFLDLDVDVLKKIYNGQQTWDDVKVMLGGQKYFAFRAQATEPRFSHNYDGSSRDRPIVNYVDEIDISSSMGYAGGFITHIPLLSYLDQEVDLDKAAKNKGWLPGMDVYSNPSFYGLIRNVAFLQPISPYRNEDIDIKIRRRWNRIKGVPLRKVWELPLIINPLRTIEEIFADLGYELLEIIEPNGKTEAPVQKSSRKRK